MQVRLRFGFVAGCGDRACRGREMQVRLRLDLSRATLCGDRACRGREMQVRLRFGFVWRKSRTKRSFWRLGASLLEEVSYETLVLGTWRFTFGGSLVRNARFGDLALHFWRKSRTKRWFWRLGVSLLEEVSDETLLLETWCLRKPRTKRSFWRLGASLGELDSDLASL